MLLINSIKNTILLFVITAISCGNTKTSNSNNEIKEPTVITLKDSVKEKLVLGANRMNAYLPLLKDKRIAIVANQTSLLQVSQRKMIDASTMGSELVNKHLVDFLNETPNVLVKKVFAPEHGFRGKADAGELVEDGLDTKTKLPIFSLHGKHKKPSNKQLEGIDMVVFDIQDVGVRFYTYISTLHYVMEACAENNIPLLILDRPNPNGSYVDGPVLEKKYSSFLGMHTIPLVHGMTIGEYAQMINGEAWLSNGVICDIKIIENKNYKRSDSYSLPVRPSPNLPNDQSIILYPSLGLFEGTNINAGRGTEFQFQRYGAPFLNSENYTFSYTPKPNFGSKHPKHNGKICYGKDLSSIKAEKKFTLKYVIDAYTNAKDQSKVFNTANFTKHAGTEKLQQQIESGLSEADIRQTWQKDLDAFKVIRNKYLIYR